jgi:potassium efflux system protein
MKPVTLDPIPKLSDVPEGERTATVARVLSICHHQQQQQEQLVKQVEQNAGVLRFPPGHAVIALVAAFFLAAAPGESAGQTTTEPQQATVPASSTAIPQAEVVPRAMEVANLLRTFAMNLAPSPAIETIQQSLPEVSGKIDRDFTETMNVLREAPTFAALETHQQLWQRQQSRMTGWLNLLTTRAIDLRGALSQLAGLQDTWTRTRDAVGASKVPGPILQQIETVLATIVAAQAPLQARLDAVLDLQGSVADKMARCNDVLSQISRAQQSAVAGILTRDSPPIWSAALWATAHANLPDRIREIAALCRTDIQQYIHDPSSRMPLHVALLVGLAVVFWAARRQVRRWAAAGEGVSSATQIFAHPYAAAFIVTLLLVTSPNSPVPPTVHNLLATLALVPVILLNRPVVHPLMVPGLYALGVLYALDNVRQAFGGVPLIEQVILLVEALVGMKVVWGLLCSQHLRQSPKEATRPGRAHVLETGGRLILLMLAAGLVAAALGYLSLARLLVPGILAGAVLALALYACVQVAEGLVAVALRVWPLGRLRMVRHHRAFLEKRTYRLLVWLTSVGWVARYLDYVGLLDPVLALGSAILATKLERGAISISIEDVLAFGLTVWVAYLLSAFIRFVLQEEVYPRKEITRGSSYAISSLLHYLMLTLGFVLGLGVLGVDLTKVSVLAGALGVGIGFGLQSVVNNFVSGLILLFEQPIQVGDTIEVGDLLGEVRRIGIRASTVRTAKGADIIVPNAQFITANVTNWTLSDRLRRIDLTVGVNYGAAPKQVIELLEAVARADPRVLRDPAPQGYFVSYGDSSINFELRAWTDHFADYSRIRSDLGAAVYDAVYAAGLSFPFPQREVRLLRESAAGASPSPQSEEGTEPPVGTWPL